MELFERVGALKMVIVPAVDLKTKTNRKRNKKNKEAIKKMILEDDFSISIIDVKDTSNFCQGEEIYAFRTRSHGNISRPKCP